MFGETVTLYNKYTEDGIERWGRAVLSGVHWEDIQGAVARKTGIMPENKAAIVIPCDAEQSGAYVTPKAYASAEDKSGLWTLQSGDTVVRGDCPYVIVRSSAELYKQYDDVLLITSVTDNSGAPGLAHWEVTAK